MDGRTEKNTSRGKRLLFGLLLCLILALLAAVCALFIRLLIKQGQEVDVSVNTSGDQYAERITVTVTNVLGMDVLLPENDRYSALLQVYEDGEWKDVCGIRFLQTDPSVLSFKYGGMFIHLSPGGELQAQIPSNRLESLSSGEYRVALRYITEDAYLSYLRERAEQIEKDLQSETSASPTVSDASDSSDASEVSVGADTSGYEENDGPELQWFYTSFRLTARKDTQTPVSPHAEVSVELE